MAARTRLVGINHVALEVGDLDEALEFYGRIFDIELESRIPGMAFIRMGDQFLALSEGRTQLPTKTVTSGSSSRTATLRSRPRAKPA